MDIARLEALRMPATYLRILAREHPGRKGILAPYRGPEDAVSEPKTISVAEFFARVRAIDAARPDRGWHLDLARRTADHFHGPLTFALVSAPTIGDGLEAFARYVQIRAPYFSSATRGTGLEFSIALGELGDLGDIRAVLCEMPFRILHDYVAMIGDVNLAAASLCLRYPRAAGSDYYERGFDCPVLFEQPANVLTMPAAWMAIPNPQYDERTWSNAVAQCELALAELNPADIVARTRAYIAVTLEGQPRNLRIEGAADTLGMSVRTLIRRLGDSGHSFQTLRDGARQKLALQLLNKPGTTMEDIASTLGFSNAANFSRAFKRWFGASPGRYRRARADQGSQPEARSGSGSP